MALDSITELSSHMGFILRHWCVLPSISGSAGSVNCSGFTGRICAVSHLATARGLIISIMSPLKTCSRRFLDSAVRSATALVENLDRKALAEAVDLIATADTVWLAGTGRTVAVKDYFQYLLTGVGIVSHVLDTSVEQILKQIRLMGKNDVVLATSFHPYSAWTTAMVAEVGASGIRCISLTDTEASSICGQSTCSIPKISLPGSGHYRRR